MLHKIVTDPKRMIGKRPNLSAQNSVADEVVSAFSNPQQEPPLPPLSPLPPRKKNPKGSSIVAAILLFLPFVYPIAFYVNGAVTGQPLPAMMYPLLVLAARLLSIVGGLVLNLAARKTNAFRKPIGWTALANPLVTIPFFVYAYKYSGNRYPDLSTIFGAQILITVSTIASLLCMIALCVFSVLIVIRVFKKRAETNN
jgi:hypothetical protein